MDHAAGECWIIVRNEPETLAKVAQALRREGMSVDLFLTGSRSDLVRHLYRAEPTDPPA
jgi:hypothetical protein